MHTYKMQNMSAEHNYCYYSLFLSFTCHCDSHPTSYIPKECLLDIYICCTYVWILVQLCIVSGSIRVISEITARGSLMAGWMSDDSLMVRSPIEIVPNQKQFGPPLSMDF